MFDFSTVPVKINLTADYILNRVSDSEILFYYHGNFKLNKRFSHPLRKDLHESGTFFLSKRGQICLFDFRDNSTLNCFEYVKKIYNLNFNECLHKVATDFGLLPKTRCIVSDKIRQDAILLEKEVKAETLIQFSSKSFTKDALRYWKLFEITEKELRENGIFQVDALYLNKFEIKNPHFYLRFAKPERYIDNEVKKIGVKIYSPEDINMKWLNSIPLDTPFNFNKLKFESNILVITKSFKDCTILKKFFTDVIGLQSENRAALSQEKINIINANYDEKFIIFDADSPGQLALSKFKELNWNLLHCPVELYEKHKVKDPADICKIFGADYLKDWLTQEKLL